MTVEDSSRSTTCTLTPSVGPATMTPTASQTMRLNQPMLWSRRPMARHSRTSEATTSSAHSTDRTVGPQAPSR